MFAYFYICIEITSRRSFSSEYKNSKSGASTETSTAAKDKGACDELIIPCNALVFAYRLVYICFVFMDNTITRR